MARRFLLAAGLLAGALSLQGCGLHPLYANGVHSPTAQGMAAVEVPDIAGKAGWLMRNALVDKLHADGTAQARYRLDVRLDDKVEGLGLLSNDTVGRERRTLRARYQLVDKATGEILMDATSGSDAGIDVVSSEYATVAAENTALENLVRIVSDQILTNVGVELRRREREGSVDDGKPAKP